MASYEAYEDYNYDDQDDQQGFFSNAMTGHTDEEAQAMAAYQDWCIPPTEFEPAEAHVPSAYDADVTTEDTAHATTETGDHIQGY